jgi:hypothetical protein
MLVSVHKGSNMEGIQPNERVALISKTNTKKHLCYFIGYGIYCGKFTVPLNDKLDKKGRAIAKKFIPCCKFITDDNKIFYDYECWEISEERFKAAFVNDEYKEGWKVIKVNRKSRH